MSDDYRFYFPIRVRYNEVDPLGFVFNSRFLEYCDAATTEYFRSVGIPPNDFVAVHRCDIVLVHTELDFVAPAHVDDLLNAYVRTAEVGRSSLTYQLEFRRAEDEIVVCRALLKYVNVDRATGRSAPVPESIRAAIAQIEGKPSAA